MIKKTVTTAFLVIAFIAFGHAQDITGKWTGKIMDQFDVTYNFKVDGEKLTGTTTGPDGNIINLQNGVIKGGDLSFTMAMMGNDIKITGKVKDDTITLSMPGMNGDGVMSFVLKKAN
jgi:hypothetical protein